MFAGAQIVTTKVVQARNRKDLIDNDDNNNDENIRNMSGRLTRSKTTIIVENEKEKLERKVLVQERKNERLVEQQKLAKRMEHLMKKVLHETPLSEKDEHHLRNQIQTIVEKVNKESNSIEQSDIMKTNNQAFLLWYNKNLN